MKRYEFVTEEAAKEFAAFLEKSKIVLPDEMAVSCMAAGFEAGYATGQIKARKDIVAAQAALLG